MSRLAEFIVALATYTAQAIRNRKGKTLVTPPPVDETVAGMADDANEAEMELHRRLKERGAFR